jgi:uncharacterized protein YkwD
MLTPQSTRRARLLAATVVLAALAVGCYGPAPSGNPPSGGTARELYEMVNYSRAASGLAPLAWDDQLAHLAQDLSTWNSVTGRLEHRDLGAVIRSPEFSRFYTMGENILVGSCGLSAGEMHQAWMNSAGHRANILSPSYNVIGIGIVCSGGRVWATQNFGGV